jgi:hypothetical protein
MYNSFLSRCVLADELVRDIARAIPEFTFVPDGSALVAVSKQACYPV